MFPLLSTDPALTAKEALVAYKYQPRLEKRFQQLKSIHEGAPLLFKHVHRVEAIMFLFFVALILQAVIERQVRLQMRVDGIEQISVYPEQRGATRPTTTKIFDRFYDVSTYVLSQDNTVSNTFRDELTTTQTELLRMLEISEDQYWRGAN